MAINPDGTCDACGSDGITREGCPSCIRSRKMQRVETLESRVAKLECLVAKLIEKVPLTEYFPHVGPRPKPEPPGDYQERARKFGWALAHGDAPAEDKTMRGGLERLRK